MARDYFDTSAIIKLYRVKPNSTLVRGCVDPTDTFLTAQFTFSEYLSAAYGWVRRQELTLQESEQLIALFANDLPNSTLLPREEAVVRETERLYAVTPGLRPLDALHLATALVEHRRVPIDACVATDNDLRQCATSEGLDSSTINLLERFYFCSS